MAQGTVLIVDDEREIRELIAFNLGREGFRTVPAKSGEEALALAERERPDLIVLDLLLPGIDGLAVCRRLKEKPATRAIPILMLTAKAEDQDIVLGLEMGAEDYLTKPFSPRVLVARIRSLLRRGHPSDIAGEKKTVRAGSLLIDPNRHLVTGSEGEIRLSVAEFDVLYLLASFAGQVFSREQIIDRIKGKEHYVTVRTIDVQVLGLRRKMGKEGLMVETVRGVGYRFREDSHG
jgi:two-component system alkaline phosphatase synthesis response regulator PhoP